jgi:hypothetical protein
VPFCSHLAWSLARWRRCSSVEYVEYSPSSRLAITPNSGAICKHYVAVEALVALAGITKVAHSGKSRWGDPLRPIMELASLFLLVLLPPADATGDTATAVTASLRSQLGDVAMAIAPDTLVTPAMWKGDKAPLRARFVVHLVWQGKDTARIEIFSQSQAADTGGLPKPRELAFDAKDSKAERGRAIGLVVAELLRESPASALAMTNLGVDKVAAERGSPSHVVLGGMFALERVRVGDWAMGPELTYDFGLSEALRLQASGTALFASVDQYAGIGVDVGAFWDFLYSERGRHALGVGLEAGVRRESATGASSDNSQTVSQWDFVAGASLGGRLTVWRTLRIVGEADLRVTSGALSVTFGEESNRTTLTFLRLRPAFALGLEFAL